MKNRKLIISLLWTSLALFLLFFSPLKFPEPYYFMTTILLLAGLGISLLIFTLKSELRKKHKIFLLLASSALIGIPVFAILHNAVYALAIHIFGEGVWGNDDEPFFFVLAAIVCPIAYLVGFIGSITCFLRIKGGSENR
jgi:predicted permease